MGITVGYGESGLENPEIGSALASVLGAEFISGAASAFCTLLSAAAGSGLASAGEGRALLVTATGRRAFPMSWIDQVIQKKRLTSSLNNTYFFGKQVTDLASLH